MSKRVLLIDDDDRIVKALELRLTTAGYEVFTARNGEDGMGQAAMLRPDAIVLDVRMPKMDGYAVCRLIRTVPDLCETPIIILSASAEPQGLLDMGANTFLRKPFQMPHLLAAIETGITSVRSKASGNAPFVR